MNKFWHILSVITYNINEVDFGCVLPVVPVPMVNPLAKQLNGRLGAILLLGRHVQVVNEHD